MTLALALAGAVAAAAILACARLRCRLRLERLAVRLAREREAAFLAAIRRLGLAARRSAGETRAELDRAIRALAPAVDAVLVYDEEDGQLTCVLATGSRVAYFPGSRLALSDLSRLPPAALARGHRVTPADGPRAFHPSDVFALAVPLGRDDGSASVVSVAAPVAVDAGTLETLVALIDHAGFAYALALEREADRRRAEYDALTGLLTPRAFRERLVALVERARYVPLARLALLFLDTDRFKTWNDTYGHASGDALLRGLAHALRTAASADGDLIARNGGDEFCLVFVDTEKSAALRRAEALRATVAGFDTSALRPPGGADLRITASIGIAAFPADAATPTELLERADAAMYHSKRNGRNAVTYYSVDGELVRSNTPRPPVPAERSRNSFSQ